MGKGFAILLLGVLLGCIGYSYFSCSRGVSILSVETNVARQFKQQWNEKKEQSDNRYIKDVKLGKFYIPGGTTNPYVEVIVFWSDSTGYTSSPVVRIGESAFAISYEVPKTQQNLNAIVKLEK